jgi:hypothetical protein
VVSAVAFRPLATATLTLALIALATSAFAQETRQEQMAAAQAAKAGQLHPYEPTLLERRIERIGILLDANRGPVYPFIGSVYSGGGLAVGPGYVARFGDTGLLDAHVAWSVRNYKSQSTLRVPALANNRIAVRHGRIGSMRQTWPSTESEMTRRETNGSPGPTERAASESLRGCKQRHILP